MYETDPIAAGPVPSAPESTQHASAPLEPIAIIGIGCRFPGADGPAAFWQLMRDGVDAITEVPPERWDVGALYDPDRFKPGKLNTRWGGFLKNIDGLDVNFFGISNREAIRLDPQHRLLMESAWEALEDAGQVPAQLDGSATGVFIGISGSDYGMNQFSSMELTDAYSGVGTALNMVLKRISYFYNFRGPGLAVDTACSSALTAVHLACRSIWDGQATLALAGGVNLQLSPSITLTLSKAGMMSPDGRCRSFDAGANGYVRADGAGVVVLKPLAQALADGDSVYAVIRGSAINQDGRSNGLTAPNGEAQKAVILDACRLAGVSPGQIDFVEAHGTGTPVGDPIEVNALGAVLAIDRPPGSYCALASVKTNIGHSESAAGIASLIKAALVLKHRQIPASLHFNEPNPAIPFDSLPLRVQTALGPLPKKDRANLVGVNGFGVGGTNIHIVLEEAPPQPPRPRPQTGARPFVLPLSTRSPAALSSLAERYRDFLAGQTEDSLSDICYTASRRRGHLDHRLAVVGTGAAELVGALSQFIDQASGGTAPGRGAAGRRRLVFVLPGQGPQWWAMGRELLEREPVFCREIERCDALLAPYTGWSLKAELTLPQSASRLDETAVAQPALFALQVALAALWRSWGVVPDAVVGHSVGEVAAAYIAGALDLEAAVSVVFHRSRLMQQATGHGKMVVTELSEPEAKRLLAGSEGLSIAAVNSPTSVVISGEPEAIDRLVASLAETEIYHRLMPVNYAFHSSQMEPFKIALIEALAGLKPQAASIAIFSTVSGDAARGEDFGAAYWGANVRQAVRFADALAALAAEDYNLFVELGPHPVLSGVITQTLQSLEMQATVLPSLRRNEPEQSLMLQSLGALYTQGYEVDWQQFYPFEGECVRLPSYPWQRERLWLDMLPSGGQAGVAMQATADNHPLLSRRLPLAQPTWQLPLDSSSPLIGACRVEGQILLSAATFIELALAAAERGLGAGSWQLTNLEISESLRFAPEASPLLQVVLSAAGDSGAIVHFYTQIAGDPAWTLRATGTIERADSGTASPTSLARLQAACNQELVASEFYDRLSGGGLDYGSPLQNLDQLWRGDGAALGRVQLPPDSLSPALFEAGQQLLIAARGEKAVPLVADQIERARLFTAPGETVWVYARLRTWAEPGEATPRGDVHCFDEDGTPIAQLEGVRLQPARSEASGIPTHWEDWLYRSEWQPRERPAERPNERKSGSWLIFGDTGSTGEALAARLRARGERCVLVVHGREYAQLGEAYFCIDPARSEDMHRLIAIALDKAKPACRGIIHLWSLDASPGETTTMQSIEAAQTLGCVSILHLIQALAAAGLEQMPRLRAVTRSVQRVEGDTGAVAIAQSPLWGLGKAMPFEHPELGFTAIDLSPQSTPAEIQSLFEECWSSERDDQVALRGPHRYVARLVRHAPPETGPAAPAALADLFGSAARQAPGPGQIELQVRAVSLKRGPDGSTLKLAQGWAGYIAAIGEGVSGFAPGDAVMAIAPGPVVPFLIVPAALAAPKPIHWSFEQAATAPVAFLIAHHALDGLARIVAGERLLVDGADTAVGLAAVHVARRRGATVFAAAATPLPAPGTEGMFDSQSPAFSDELRSAAGGAAMDVVLSCRPGTSARRSARTLGACGRFVRLGGAAAGTTQNNLAHFAVELETLIHERPAVVGVLFTEVLSCFEAGIYAPLPVQAVNFQEAERLSEPETPGTCLALVLSEPAAGAASLQPDGTYLITGGLGGLGWSLAERLVKRGARHLALLGRRGPNPAAQQAIDRMRAAGAEVRVIQADIGRDQEVADVLNCLGASMPPLRGIVHAAGVLANGFLLQMDEERFRAVMHSKVNGAWNLHVHTANTPLDFFVVYASLASLFGSPGQGNYAAANAFLDALAHHRKAQGQPALSVCWGPWSEVGMVVNENAQERLEEWGLGGVSSEKGLDALEALLGQEEPQVGVIPIDWRMWYRYHPVVCDSPYFSCLVERHDPPAQASGPLTAEALAALPPDERCAVLESRLTRAIAQVLQLDPERVDHHQSLSAMGLDSLVALEVKNRIESAIGTLVSVTSLLRGPTIAQLAEQLLSKLVAPPTATALPAPVEVLDSDQAEALLGELEQLSDEQVHRLLNSILAEE